MAKIKRGGHHMKSEKSTRAYERPQVMRRESVKGVLGEKGGGSYQHPGREN